MTPRIKKYKDEKFFVLPALAEGLCDGCVFYERDARDEHGMQLCPHNDESSRHFNGCTGDDFELDLMWIPPTKKALAVYIAKKLEGPDEMG